MSARAVQHAAGTAQLDAARLREDFPIFRREVHGRPLAYLDSASTAQKPRQVLDAMVDLYSTSYANVHRGVYTIAQEATEAYEAVRERGVDVFLAGVAGRNFTDDYWRRIIPRLDPKVVVPTHYDNFFRPLGQRLEFVSDVRLSALPEEIGAVSGDLEIAAIPRADLSS